MLDASSPTIITPYLTVAQVAERFNVSTDSIWCWKREGKFPAPYRVGPNCTRWRLSDIELYESSLQMCFMTEVMELSNRSRGVKALDHGLRPPGAWLSSRSTAATA